MEEVKGNWRHDTRGQIVDEKNLWEWGGGARKRK